ncbi:hypothetical protein ACSBR1_017676 [Camellia fascicularis]
MRMKKTEIAILILQGGSGNRDCDFRRKTTTEEWRIWNFGRKMTVVGMREEEEGEEKRVEVNALNSIFGEWGLSASNQRNISGEPCSGAAIDLTSVESTDGNYNPGIKCHCDGTTCQITRLKVYALDVVGVIPEELWTFDFPLQFIHSFNVLAPHLNVVRTVHINALSGELPKELGKLTNLRSLKILLLLELGNGAIMPLPYYCAPDSSGDVGHIPTPSTFAALRHLQTVWASDNELTGSIPEFIGNWSKLKSLRFQGNSFGGPIPATFSNLTLMEDLRISDLSNESSSLVFLKDMKSLNLLILRNNNISGSIPSNIGDYQSLLQLDLSFNKLIGQIPDSLFNLSSLSYLFLGNNKLTGTLPAQKSTSLLNIVLPSGLSAFKETFPAIAMFLSHISKPKSGEFLSHWLIDSRFAIKCGGPQITSSNQIIYERDNETLGPATYYVTSTNRWAISNVGRFGEKNNAQYTSFSSFQFTNTLNSELFQTARIFAGSLRYYGLGLQNGNYTVSLQFVELTIENLQLGKVLESVFLTYISRGIWSGKILIYEWRQVGPLCNLFRRNSRLRYQKLTLKSISFGLVKGLALYLLKVHMDLLFRQSVSPQSSEGWMLSLTPFSYAELKAAVEDFHPANKLREGGFGPVYKQQYTFTIRFCAIVGDVVFVEKKIMENLTLAIRAIFFVLMVAVKQLSVASRQGKSQFVTEIATISPMQHQNLVKLYGCCIEGDKLLLVYEYLENRSLDQALFGNRSLYLDWPTRFDICFGVARGLAYLHEESRLRIVHKDMKASNILLDSGLNPKISNFGLAKHYDDKKTHMSTRIAGDDVRFSVIKLHIFFHYIAPEYAMRGYLTEKADVFSFGVVALEIINGRLNFDSSLEQEKIYLLEWV